MIWVQLGVLAAVVGGAIAVVKILDKRARYEIVSAYGSPSSVKADDFPAISDGPAVLLFTHVDCRACATVRSRLRRAALNPIETDDPGTLEKYGIDGVPATLVVARGGAVAASWVGPVKPDEVRKALVALDD